MWTEEFVKVLPLLGHRNWILVVDKAFPLQSAPGMTYLNTGEQLPDVLERVLSDIQKSSHVRPVIYFDTELTVLDENFCKGIDELRNSIKQVINEHAEGAEIQQIPHEKIFSKLDEASKLFNVMVLKTEAVLPYTSVFIQLDCGYWTADQEAELRKWM